MNYLSLNYLVEKLEDVRKSIEDANDDLRLRQRYFNQPKALLEADRNESAESRSTGSSNSLEGQEDPLENPSTLVHESQQDFEQVGPVISNWTRIQVVTLDLAEMGAFVGYRKLHTFETYKQINSALALEKRLSHIHM